MSRGLLEDKQRTSGTKQKHGTGMEKESATRISVRLIGWLALACLAAWIVKSTVVSVSRISSPSMSPTLDPGEYVLISRSSYRLRTPDSFPLSSFPFPSISIHGWGEVERGDIVAFLSPQDLARGLHPSRVTTYAKRCVAVPGDTVRLAGRALQVQGEHRSSVEAHRYSVSNLRGRERKWVVPSRGDTLRLGLVSEDQLQRIVRRDGHRVAISETGIQIDGRRQDYYVTEQNYYFVLGDNPDMSRDSRHWGLVPETALLGEVLGVIWPLGFWDSES